MAVSFCPTASARLRRLQREALAHLVRDARGPPLTTKAAPRRRYSGSPSPSAADCATAASCTQRASACRFRKIWPHPFRKNLSSRPCPFEKPSPPEGWVEEGATDLDQEAEIVAGDAPEAAVRTTVRFKVGDDPKVSAMRWRADEDGTIFRVCVSAPPYVPESEMRDQADAVMASLRRLDAGEGGGGPRAPKKPWWRVW